MENRKQHIETAITFLREKVSDMTVAPIYETRPLYFAE